MSELDLGLKVASRRLLWRLGYSTRIDVPLRAVKVIGEEESQTRTPESFTDLDVLGISITPGMRVRSALVDCKTGGSSTISRMFWVRGLADFFAADDAYMVRERAITKEARQLASRLGLTAVTGEEITILESLHQTKLILNEGPLSLLFDEEHVAKVMTRLTGQDRRLKALLDFRQFDYWVYPEHQNLMKMVDQLSGARDVLVGSSPQHTGILLDCAWLYVVSIAHALQELRSVHISDLSYGLSEYLAGGPAQLEQKRDVAKILSQLKESKQIPDGVTISSNPRYFSSLLELLNRLLRRSDLLTDILRLLEFQSAMAIAGDKIPATDAFGEGYDMLVAKLASDVVTFLIDSADLDRRFSETTRELLLSTKVAAPSGASHSAPADAPTRSPGSMHVALFDEHEERVQPARPRGRTKNG